MAERDSLRVIPLLFLTAFLAPYLILLARYGIAFAVDEYTLWVFFFTLAQALASAAFSVVAGLALLPIYVRAPALKPVVMATVWGWEKLKCPPPIEVGQKMRALAVAAPYAGDKVLKYLVKRVSHRDLVAFVEGTRILPV